MELTPCEPSSLSGSPGSSLSFLTLINLNTDGEIYGEAHISYFASR